MDSSMRQRLAHKSVLFQIIFAGGVCKLIHEHEWILELLQNQKTFLVLTNKGKNFANEAAPAN